MTKMMVDRQLLMDMANHLRAQRSMNLLDRLNAVLHPQEPEPIRPCVCCHCANTIPFVPELTNATHAETQQWRREVRDLDVYRSVTGNTHTYKELARKYHIHPSRIGEIMQRERRRRRHPKWVEPA